MCAPSLLIYIYMYVRSGGWVSLYPGCLNKSRWIRDTRAIKATPQSFVYTGELIGLYTNQLYDVKSNYFIVAYSDNPDYMSIYIYRCSRRTFSARSVATLWLCSGYLSLIYIYICKYNTHTGTLRVIRVIRVVENVRTVTTHWLSLGLDASLSVFLTETVRAF